MEPKSRHVDMGALDQIAAEDVKIQTPYATNLETWMAIEAVSKATGYGLSISGKFPTQEGYGRLRRVMESGFRAEARCESPPPCFCARLITEAP